MSDAVFVTGVGVVSPAGTNARDHHAGLTVGGRFVRPCRDDSLTGGGARPAGMVAGFSPPTGLDRADRVCQLAVTAADEAVAAADLAGADHPPADPSRIAVSFGTSKGGIAAFDAWAERVRHRNPYEECEASFSHISELISGTKSNPLKTSFIKLKELTRGHKSYLYKEAQGAFKLLETLSAIPPDASARLIARRHGFNAGAHATVAACATGSLAVTRAVQLLQEKQADAVVAGSADASLVPLWFAAFERMGVLAGEHRDRGAAWACRPFDAGRRGFVVGEGAGALVLESAESVARRGIQPLARIVGHAVGTDPAGLASLHADGAPLARTLEIACGRAGIRPAELAAIQAHGTATPANDLAEIRAIRHLCGPTKPSEIPVVSLKGAIGHLLGGAGAVELAACVLAIRQGVLPPNATLLEPDPAFGEVYLPIEPLHISSGPIAKLSMGFGGHLAAIILDNP